MNKKTVMIASGTTGLILALGACGKGTYEYEVSGTVQEQYVDYDCPGEDLAMEPIAFVEGKNPGTTKNKSSGDSDEKKGDGKDPKAVGQQVAPQGAPQAGKKSATPSPTVTKNSGVKLKEKPEKPERIKGAQVPNRKYKSKPKGCKTEYEIFILDSGGDLYEQDVRKADYDACAAVTAVPKLFPLCTEG